MRFQFAEDFKYLPILAPADIAATPAASQYVDLGSAHWATFAVNLGALTASTGTVTVECSTAASSNATEAAVPFNYRLTSAVGTDSMGAITAATSDGASLAATDDNKTMLIELDPQAIPGNPGEAFRYARVVITPATDNTVYICSATAILQPRYPGNAIPSDT